jgi:hypothetical protein
MSGARIETSRMIYHIPMAERFKHGSAKTGTDGRTPGNSRAVGVLRTETLRSL